MTITRIEPTGRLVAAATATATLVSIVALAPPASAAPGDIALASIAGSGVKSNGYSCYPSLSGDGATTAFHSAATNLDPADTDLFYDVYVKDLVSGDLVLASTSDTGVKANGYNWYPSLSDDGSKVAFRSDATNLDPADKARRPDVYVKDLATGDILLASTSDTGVKGLGDSYDPSLSADGAAVAFYSAAANLDPADTDVTLDVYVKDLATGDIVLASTSDAGVKGNEHSYLPSLSADGGTVAFFTVAGNLDPADTDPVHDIYVKDLVTGDIVLASTSDTGSKGNGYSYNPSLAADGARVAFHTGASNLDPADTDDAYDVYVKDVATGDIVLASTSDTGVKGNAYSYNASLSADGATVGFYSFATNLDPADTDSFADVYVKDLVTGDIALASTSATGIKGNDESVYPSLSADGAAVAFCSEATNLEPADADSQVDVYVKELSTAAPPVTMTISNQAKDEGDVGVTKLRLRVTLSAASAGTVTVDYATADLSAVAGSDYTARTGTLTFAPGVTSKNIVVDVLGDTVVEPTERFRVTLTNASGATVIDAEATARILDDDA